MVTKKANTPKHQPPMPPKGASSTEIKAWLAQCHSRMTPEEIVEYEATGEDLKAIYKRMDFDPNA